MSGGGWGGGAPYGWKTTASKEENELQVHYLLSSRTGTVDFFFLVLQNQAKQKTQCSSDSCTDQIRTQQQYSA